MTAKIVQFGLSRPLAEETIHQLAAAGRFVIEPACREKMLVRDFSMTQVRITLTEGCINQGPRLDDCNDWRCRIKKRVAGRLVRVVVAIHNKNFLYVVSVH